jgi:hypothetical protein
MAIFTGQDIENFNSQLDRDLSLGTIVVQFLTLTILALILIGFSIPLILARRPTIATICPSNACPVNKFTYEKDCSNLEYNPAYSTCVIATTCQSREVPCSLQLDGSSSCPGEQGGSECPIVNGVATECGCTSNRLCANYIRAFFVPQTFQSQGSFQNYYIMQTGTVNLNNQYTWNSPLNAGYYQNGNQCTLDSNSLERVIGKECLSGHLTKFGDNNYGCAIGTGCPLGQHAVWNFNNNQAQCEVVPNWPEGWL